MDIINVQFINMDVMIPEHLVLNQDGSYTVFINARLTCEKQKESYMHALKHIQNDDFYKSCSADEIEMATH